MSEDALRMLDIAVYCIWAFAHHHGIPQHQAYPYLRQYGGIQYLLDFSDSEGTLCPDEVAEDLTDICNHQGGTLSC